MTRLTVPTAGTSPGRTAQAQPVPANQTGGAFADLGQRMMQVGNAIETDRLDRELKRAQVDMTRDVNALRLEVEGIGDPDAADAAWRDGSAALRARYLGDKDAGVAGSLDPRIAERAGLTFDSLSDGVAYSLGRRSLDLRLSQREATYISYAHEAAQLGASANPETIDVLMAQGFEQIDGLVAAGVIDAAEAERRKIGLRSDIDNARAIKQVAEDPAGFLVGSTEGAFPGLEADVTARYQVQAQNNIDAEAARIAREQEAAAKDLAKAVDDKVKDLRDIAKDGREGIDEAFLDTPEAQASEFYGEAKAALELRNEFGSLSLMTPDQLDTLIAEEEARKVEKPYQTERLKVLKDLQDEAERGYSEDPIAYASRQGLVDTAPIDFGADSETLAAALQQRAAIGDELAARGYTRNRAILTADEAAQMSAAIGTDADPEQRLRVASTIAAALGTGELIRMGGDPTVTHAADFVAAGGAPLVALDILRGQAALKEQNVKLPPLADRRGESFEILDQVFADVPGGEAIQSRVLAAADGLYARRMGRIDPTADLDPEIYGQALHEALGGQGRRGSAEARGGVGTVNGAPILLPRGISAEEAEQALDWLGTAPTTGAAGLVGMRAWSRERMMAQLGKASGGRVPAIGGAAPTRDTLEQMQPLAVGDDRYILVRPSRILGASPEALTDTTGEPFTFSLRKLIREVNR